MGWAKEEVKFLPLHPSQSGQEPDQRYLHEHPANKEGNKQDVVENRHITPRA